MKDFSAKLPQAVRNIDAGDYFENFFIFSIVSVIGIRLFLELTGYPQLGGEGLHIAHMLWGGIFLTAALFLHFFFLNKAFHQLASILAGIGFGTFIDELGKFITADNDYFYQPTVAIIYSVFVLLYLVSFSMRKKFVYSSREYVANALEATKEAVVLDFDEEEKRKALDWLTKAKTQDRFTMTLQKMIEREQVISARQSVLTQIRHRFTEIYVLIIKTNGIRIVALVFLVLQAIGYLALLASLIIFRITGQGIFYWGLVVSSTLAMVFLMMGILALLWKSYRQRALGYFRYSLLINILLVTFFGFYFNRPLTLLYVLANITFLKVVEYAMAQEKVVRITKRLLMICG